VPNNYRDGSVWSDELELKCFLIFKQAEMQNFKRGLVTELCRKLAKKENLDEGTLKAKVGNYKSLAGYTRPTNASTASILVYEQYKDHTIEQLESLLRGNS
jgi:hypothetical protein